jgi:hypothetical protein
VFDVFAVVFIECSLNVHLMFTECSLFVTRCDTISCGLSEGYGKRAIPPAAYPTADPNQKRTMCHDGRKHTFKFSACTKCGERDFGRNFGPARARDADKRAGSPGRAPSRGRASTVGLDDKRSQFQSAFNFPAIL